MSLIRQRTTFFVDSDDLEAIDSLEIENNDLILPPLAHSRQDKMVVPLSQLDGLIMDLLMSLKSLRIQWSSFADYDKNQLHSEAIQSGLNIYFLPNGSISVDEVFDNLISVVDQWLGIQLQRDSFIILPTSAQFYAPIQQLPAELLSYLSELLHQDASYFAFSDSLDITFKQAASEMVIQGFFSDSSRLNNGDKTVFSYSPDYKKEIGIFSRKPEITTIDNLGLAGVRYVLDQQSSQQENKLHQTFFQIKPRHRPLNSSYKVSIGAPIGLHPSVEVEFDNLIDPEMELQFLDTSFKVSEDPDAKKCKLFYYENIPNDFFLDKYQLPTQFEDFHIWGNQDLEAPKYTIDQWGQSILTELNMGNNTNFHFNLHSRYQLPMITSAPDSRDDSLGCEVPTPMIFYACDPTIASNKDSNEQLLSKSPFDGKFLGYESFFDDNTIFYHLHDVSESRLIEIPIPRANGSLNVVNGVTGMVILVSLVFLLWKILRVVVTRQKVKKE